MNPRQNPSNGPIASEQEQRTTRRLERFAVTLLCIGLASTALTAMGTRNARAAQPGAAGTTVPTTRSVPGIPATMPAPTPGTLTALKAPATTEMNTSLTFNFAGVGHCKLALNGGDGVVTEFTGELPFTASHFYSSGSMSSFEAFKDYTASVMPSGACKTAGAGPFSVTVRVVNPHPQSAGGPPKDNTVVVVGGGVMGAAAKTGLTIAAGASAPKSEPTRKTTP